MKKVLLIVAFIAALFSVAPTKVEAGHYPSRVIGTCPYCHHSIYSYYRPVRYSSGYVRYSWVPAYHTSCASRYRSSHSHSYGGGHYYGSGYSGYRGSSIIRIGPGIGLPVPGFSISFGNGGFHCW